MYISKPQLTNGYNEYITLDSPVGRLSLMDVGLLILDAGEQFQFQEPEKEIAVLLIEGKAEYEWRGASLATRKNCFDFRAWCLHAPRGTRFAVKALEHSEFYVQKTLNQKTFEPKLYSPEQTQTQKAGAKGELDGMMRRNIRTIFDYDAAPYSNMVLGEVINFPGRWSSYPPHHHPQPEVYFYRYDKPQGFGVGFTNGNVYETHHNGLLLITDKFHSQASAPGYTLYYAWGIRHLEGNPWKKTRIDDAEHSWLLAPNPAVWKEKEQS